MLGSATFTARESVAAPAESLGELRMRYSYKGRTNLTAVQLMFVIRKDMEFAMPPRGVTIHRSSIGGKKYERITWRCEVEGCWHVCFANDDAHLLKQQEAHRNTSLTFHCPSPPMRESLPSGLPEIEKLWRELDDVTDALVAKESYRDMSGEELKAFAKGISFVIVMKDKFYFPDIQSVAKESVERWKMRNDKTPYRKTPTTHSTNGSFQVVHGWREVKDEFGTVERPPVDTPAGRSQRAKLNDKQISAIKIGMQSGMFSADELASTYGISPALVDEIAKG